MEFYARKLEERLLAVIGQKFNRLTPVALSHHDSHGDYWYLCECECGNMKLVRKYHFMSGHTQSCGCLWKEHNTKPRGQAAFDGIYNRYKKNATDRNMDFGLTKQEFQHITSQNCFYCNSPPSQGDWKDKRNNGQYIHNGIDRIDNDLGYTLKNSVPCCFICNVAKHSQSLDEFKKWVTGVYNHFIKEKQ